MIQNQKNNMWEHSAPNEVDALRRSVGTRLKQLKLSTVTLKRLKILSL